MDKNFERINIGIEKIDETLKYVIELVKVESESLKKEIKKISHT